MKIQRPPLSQIMVFTLGQLGWSMVSYAPFNFLVYFYMPPETADAAVFPNYIFQGAILGIVTIIGLINFSGRIFDAITDPLIANWSDRTDAKMGKRKKLMAISAGPFAALAFLMFFPLSSTPGMLNTAWLCVTVILFYLAMTVYIIPFYALISELGHYPKDRMLITTLLSVAWSVGFLVGSSTYAIQSALEASFSSTVAFQITIGGITILALLLMLVPVFFLNEKKYCYQTTHQTPAFSALREVFGNRNFQYFAIGDLMYWLALTFIQLGISFYVTVIFEFEKSMAFTFLAVGFGTSFLFYVPINILVRHYGKKRVLSVSFLIFCSIFAMTALLQYIPISKSIMFYLLAALSGFPLAAFGAIPSAIIADLIYENEEETGRQQSGMFYAARNFTQKLGISLANLIFPSLLLLGKSQDAPTGIKASVILALVFCLLGFIVFSFFKERQK